MTDADSTTSTGKTTTPAARGQTATLQGIGLFLIVWQTFDELLEYVIWREARLSRTHATILLSGLGFERKASIARSLLALKSPKYNAAIKSINNITNVAERNLLIHGITRLAGSNVRYVKRQTDNSLKMSDKTYSASSIASKVREVFDLVTQFMLQVEVTHKQVQSWEKTTDSLLSKFGTSPKPPSS